MSGLLFFSELSLTIFFTGGGSVMNKETVIAMMKERDFQYDLEIRNGKGKTVKYCFHSGPVYSRRHKDIVIIPSYSCSVYPDTEEFELAYIVPHGLNILKTSKCGSVNNNDHFDRICHKFGIALQALLWGDKQMKIELIQEEKGSKNWHWVILEYSQNTWCNVRCGLAETYEEASETARKEYELLQHETV